MDFMVEVVISFSTMIRLDWHLSLSSRKQSYRTLKEIYSLVLNIPFYKSIAGSA